MKRTVFGLLAAVLLASCGPSEEARIKQEIQAANHCEVKEDCAVVQSKCPFDCYVLTHASEVERIDALISGYESTCEYGCIPQPSYDCVEGKCQFQQP